MGEPIGEIQGSKMKRVTEDPAWLVLVGFTIGLYVMYFLMAWSESARKAKERAARVTPNYRQTDSKLEVQSWSKSATEGIEKSKNIVDNMTKTTDHMHKTLDHMEGMLDEAIRRKQEIPDLRADPIPLIESDIADIKSRLEKIERDTRNR